ncbi:MAG: hypothetical protein IJG62_00615 [Synergistaceae bacterium]|nr:hypothetical protein [Synergistaceae bacterium]MBQ3627080.1 hypothetical protein [Synergistaceae bacterium]MBQ7569437.1 hypothetical protein [Synergistaceae bacterium]MBQ9581809.1 hypothetical protein [Synergistaceae bacterium]MBR0096362.1 hypothetical protein [Synergistaceae bacterium]
MADICGRGSGKNGTGLNIKVLDYGEDFIYLGFLDSHTHWHLACMRFIGQANLKQVGLTNYAKYREIIQEFI